MDIFKNRRKKNSNSKLIDWPYNIKTDWRVMTKEEKFEHWRLSYDNRLNDLELEFEKSIIKIPNEIKEICYNLIEGEIFEIIMLDPDIIIQLAYKIRNKNMGICRKIMLTEDIKNMENKEKTPWNIMVTDNYMPNGNEHSIGINLFFKLVEHMMKNNLIIDVNAGYLAFKEKENMRTEIKPNGEVHLHIHSLLKEVKELHIPPVDQETDIKSQVIDIITKALQEAKIKTDGTK